LGIAPAQGLAGTLQSLLALHLFRMGREKVLLQPQRTIYVAGFRKDVSLSQSVMWRGCHTCACVVQRVPGLTWTGARDCIRKASSIPVSVTGTGRDALLEMLVAHHLLPDIVDMLRMKASGWAQCRLSAASLELEDSSTMPHSAYGATTRSRTASTSKSLREFQDRSGRILC
jgi:hypothetical protein